MNPFATVKIGRKNCVFDKWHRCFTDEAYHRLGVIRQAARRRIDLETAARYSGLMKHAESVRIVEIINAGEMEQAWRIRRSVFIEEQGVPEEIEMDAHDATAFHVIALDDETPVGCGRMVPHEGAVKIGRMAVVRERRGEGIGEEILAFLMDAARDRGYAKAILHAQLHAEGFYLKCGYKPVGEIFEEAGIPHRLMERML